MGQVTQKQFNETVTVFANALTDYKKGNSDLLAIVLKLKQLDPETTIGSIYADSVANNLNQFDSFQQKYPNRFRRLTTAVKELAPVTVKAILEAEANKLGAFRNVYTTA